MGPPAATVMPAAGGVLATYHLIHRCGRPSDRYSARSATIGLTWVARRAGR